jgi:nucleotide-binding universal stress UspA family protein
MFRNVIVGVDGRSGGRDAVALAANLLGPGGVLALAHVQPADGIHAGASTAPLDPPSRLSSLDLLEAARTEAGLAASLLTTSSRSVGHGLHDLAERAGCDLLVVGSCSRGFFERATGIDDTRAALNGASWAVAVAPAGYAEHATPLTEIGVGFDGSPDSERALELAQELARQAGARVSAFEAVSIHPSLFSSGAVSFGEAIDVIVRGARKRIEAHGNVEAHVALGSPVQELTLYSASVSLLVLGSHGYGPLGRLVHGSISNQLARSASCPLLVLAHADAAGYTAAGIAQTAAAR